LCLSATAILWGLAENPERGGLEMDLGGGLKCLGNDQNAISG
jgi:hypothetical protein